MRANPFLKARGKEGGREEVEEEEGVCEEAKEGIRAHVVTLHGQSKD